MDEREMFSDVLDRLADALSNAEIARQETDRLRIDLYNAQTEARRVSDTLREANRTIEALKATIAANSAAKVPGEQEPF